MSVRAGLKAKRSGQKAVEAKQQNRSELEVVLEFTVCFKIIQLACELSLQAIQCNHFSKYENRNNKIWYKINQTLNLWSVQVPMDREYFFFIYILTTLKTHLSRSDSLASSRLTQPSLGDCNGATGQLDWEVLWLQFGAEAGPQSSFDEIARNNRVKMLWCYGAAFAAFCASPFNSFRAFAVKDQKGVSWAELSWAERSKPKPLDFPSSRKHLAQKSEFTTRTVEFHFSCLCCFITKYKKWVNKTKWKICGAVGFTPFHSVWKLGLVHGVWLDKAEIPLRLPHDFCTKAK